MALILSDRPLLRLMAMSLLSGLLLTLTGACDTYDGPFAVRLFYWTGVTALSIAALEAAQARLMRHPRIDQAITARVLGWALLVLPLNMASLTTCKLLFGKWPTFAGFMFLLPGTAAILAALQFTLAKFPLAKPQVADTDDSRSEAAPSLRDSFPLPLRKAHILALEAEDHYVRVHTCSGQTVLRIRLRDAVEQVGAEGIRPHRSWWVAHDAVAAVQRGSRRTVLTLVNGQSVPVSRNHHSVAGPAFLPSAGT